MTTPFSNRFRTAIATAALAIALIASGCQKPVDDPTLTTAVQQRLSGDAALQTEQVQVAVQNGIVTLNGTVSSEAARSLAAQDTSTVQGVKQVVNNLQVAPAPNQAMTPIAPPVQEKAPVAPAPARKKVKAPKQEVVKPAPVTRIPPPAPAPVARTEPAPPPQPARPAYRDVTLPVGTTLAVRLTQTLDSGQNQTGDSFSGTLSNDLIEDGATILHRGATVNGRVVEAKDAAHFKGSSLLSVQLVSMNIRGERTPIQTDAVTQEGKGRGKNTATKAGIGAAAGAVLGGIFGGGKGAAIGAAAGGGTGVGINAVTKGQQVQLPSETVLRFHLTSPITVRVPNN